MLVLLWKKAIEVRNGTLLLIEELLRVQLLEDIVDVSKSSLETKMYYSVQAFKKLMTLLAGYDTSNITKADLTEAKHKLLKEEPVSYRLEPMTVSCFSLIVYSPFMRYPKTMFSYAHICMVRQN